MYGVLLNFAKFDLHNLIAITEVKYNALSDQELVDLFRTGLDLNILGLLYKRYMLLVYGVCMKYLKNRDDSKDAVMQIFEVLVKDIPRFEIKNFRAWLHGVCRNHCLMKIRKDLSEKNRYDKIQHEYFMESEDETHLFDTDHNEQMQGRLKECMERLKAEQRRCIELFYYEGTCYRDIAEMLELNENNVKSFIQNGKRNLKICLETQTTVKNARDQQTI